MRTSRRLGLSIVLSFAAVAAFGPGKLTADVIVYYTVESGSGDRWTGEIVVANLDAFVQTAVSINAEGFDPAPVEDFASATGWLSWLDSNDNDLLYVKSATLYNTVFAAFAWNTPWSELIGKSYAIADEEDAVRYQHPDEWDGLSGRGGQISFSQIPEPATALSIVLGGLIVTGYRRIRKSYGL